MTAFVVSDTRCQLGEGALWHPQRQSLFWFDILGKTLFENAPSGQRQWTFDRCVSAAGWLDKNRLLIATARDLITFDLESGAETHLLPLEADDPVTRSNDGRADPYGGFWIGTMGYNLEPGAGAIYRYYRGTLRKLYAAITVSNAICFSPDGRHAYFTDTPTRVIKRVALDNEGWPTGDPENWLDLNADGLNPDGAVVDADGNFWNAQWGAERVARYNAEGQFAQAYAFPASQISCPCFGGTHLSTLFATSAAVGAPDCEQQAGQTFGYETTFRGQAEHRVIL